MFFLPMAESRKSKKMNDQKKWLKIAIILSLITIGYNVVEGILSVYFGTVDDTLALLGFGIDSFVEVISGIGIFHMLIRMKSTSVTQHDYFERQALRITGSAFYLLTAGLLTGIVINLFNGTTPSSTLAGIIISVLSAGSMYALMHYKLKAGRALNSEAIISDAQCTRTCLYLSVILLVSSLSYELLQIPYLDLAGSMGIAWFSFKEGREAFEKARKNELSCSCNNCHH
jgi:divalent metal cation (Fe/Co/Zn/Cd) transporter